SRATSERRTDQRQATHPASVGSLPNSKPASRPGSPPHPATKCGRRKWGIAPRTPTRNVALWRPGGQSASSKKWPSGRLTAKKWFPGAGRFASLPDDVRLGQAEDLAELL